MLNILLNVWSPAFSCLQYNIYQFHHIIIFNEFKFCETIQIVSPQYPQNLFKLINNIIIGVQTFMDDHYAIISTWKFQGYTKLYLCKLIQYVTNSDGI